MHRPSLPVARHERAAAEIRDALQAIPKLDPHHFRLNPRKLYSPVAHERASRQNDADVGRLFCVRAPEDLLQIDDPPSSPHTPAETNCNARRES